MIKACIFDLDGTLADTLTTLSHFGNLALSACGYRIVPHDRYAPLIGNGANNLISGLIQVVTGVPPFPGEVARVRAEYDKLYGADPLHLTQVFDGILPLLTNLRKEGVSLAVLSNKPHDVTCSVIEKLFPADTFACYYGQREHIARKPAPDGAIAISEELAIDSSEILYIGDSGVDMQTGKAAGMPTVGVLWGYRDEAELKRYDATFIVKHPSEILNICKNFA